MKRIRVNVPKQVLYLGIDPGNSGGLACIGSDGLLLEAIRIPFTERDIWNWVSRVEYAFAVIEKVGGYVRGNPTPGSRMFNFGHGYGGLRMALVAAEIPFEAVTSGVWQKAMGISPRKKTEGRTQFKNRLKAKAQELFPKFKMTLAVCDAVLIAEYCRRMHDAR